MTIFIPVSQITFREDNDSHRVAMQEEHRDPFYLIFD